MQRSISYQGATGMAEGKQSNTDIRRFVTREAAQTGAIYYRPDAAGEFAAQWFEPRYWRQSGGMVSEPAGQAGSYLVREGRRHLLLRHYERAGLLKNVLGDWWLWRGERVALPIRELVLLTQLHAAGVPVVVPVAARYQRYGRVYRGDLLVEYPPDAQTLAQALQSGSVPLTVWAQLGRGLRRCHDLGVWQPRFDARKVLLRGDEQLLFSDFCGARQRHDGMWKDAVLASLRRSIEGHADVRRQPLDEVAWDCLLAAYG